MNKLIKEIKDNNTWEYNHLKAIEELTELQEVLIKKVTKKGGPKEPTDRSIIDEIGDVQIRLEILALLYGENAVATRVFDKLDKLSGYLKEGKYKGSL